MSHESRAKESRSSGVKDAAEGRIGQMSRLWRDVAFLALWRRPGMTVVTQYNMSEHAYPISVFAL
ncbi:MAG: hypothetical protein JNK33_06735 [Candidatus Doudnabacteria bacterium]|nr:hypothetical protein [Candidatus Doudnabacteria bacterium]